MRAFDLFAPTSSEVQALGGLGRIRCRVHRVDPLGDCLRCRCQPLGLQQRVTPEQRELVEAAAESYVCSGSRSQIPDASASPGSMSHRDAGAARP
jgi:hypothetical protein